jgi:hypothetical protein
MPPELRQALAHVLWIGGAADAGKSTVARMLAERRGLQVYHYDRRDQAHIERLAQADPRCRAFLAASLDERWVQPDPDELARRALQVFRDRIPLVVEDLLALPRETQIVAEGFGLLPELLAPLLFHPRQALWLAPSVDFKQASMARRGKPSFAALVSDPKRARANLLARDHLLAEHIRAQVRQYGGVLYEIDGARSAAEMVDRIDRYFSPLLSR